jgi:hypothetical protein
MVAALAVVGMICAHETAAQSPARPDLSGNWAEGGSTRDGFDPSGTFTQLAAGRDCHPGQAVCVAGINQSLDGALTGRMDPNRPVYKPEYWERVKYLDRNTNTEEPILRCQPAGVPRMGMPTKIVQTGGEVILIYAQGGASSAPQDFRIIPTDGRKHDPIRSQDLTYYGHSVGHWEGDVLVIDSVGFNDLTWLQRGGYFHSNNMRVIERFRREGDRLHYQATVIDPDVLIEPWVMNAMVARLNTDPDFFIPEGLPCDERDSQHIILKIRH